MDDSDKKAHSEEYFGKARDFWWNEDYLELLAKRLNLKNCNKLLDVGCGVGYMGFKLAPYLNNNAKVFGFDFEKRHIEKAKNKARSLNNDNNIEFIFDVGDANNIALEDNSVDVAICQTLLLHVKSPQNVIKEMKRVTKNGGCVVAIEPNNSINSLIDDNLSNGDIKEKIEILEARMIIEKGKAALGKGFNSIGDFIPQFFIEQGLKDIKVWLSDKPTSIIPPYNDLENKSRVEEYLQWFENGESFCNYEEELEYYLNGGGAKEGFDTYWNKIMLQNDRIKEAMLKGEYITAGGGLMYIVAGTK